MKHLGWVLLLAITGCSAMRDMGESLNGVFGWAANNVAETANARCTGKELPADCPASSKDQGTAKP